MSSRLKKLKADTGSYVRCDDCGLVFDGDLALQMHYKHLPEARICLSTSTMTRVLRFYRSRGAWRLGRIRSGTG